MTGFVDIFLLKFLQKTIRHSMPNEYIFLSQHSIDG